MLACRPSGVLSSRQMRNVLYDMHRADAILQVGGYSYGHDEQLAKSYQLVLDKHGITQAQFDSSLVWYTDHPQIFDKIYPKVVARLEADQQAWEDAHMNKERKEVIERDLPEIEEVERIYRHGYTPFWPNMQENEEKCEKNLILFAYSKNFS